jgi:hypothetical protein
VGAAAGLNKPLCEIEECGTPRGGDVAQEGLARLALAAVRDLGPWARRVNVLGGGI